MSDARSSTRLALALLAATCLTPVSTAQAAPGDRIGAEFQVNTTTAGSQFIPSVAMNANGRFVVVWHGCSVDWQTDCEVFGQRYDAAGQPVGGEFQVNTTATGDQKLPVVAMDDDGNFVVAWNGPGPGDDRGVFAQRYSATGAPLGQEFAVNAYTSDSQWIPAIAMDADGDFVVTWQGYGPGDDMEPMGSGVFARRFDAAGQPQGGDFRVNTTTNDSQLSPTVAMSADGDFVVAWESWYQDGSRTGVFAQRYSAAGVPMGQEFLVNDYTAGTQHNPTAAMDADGDFVVAWESYGQDGSDVSIFARRFDAAGNPLGDEFRVNTVTQGRQAYASVSMDADGDFVVTWDSYYPQPSLDVKARRFNAAGQPQGGEFRVAMTSYSTADSAVAMDADGDFVVAWNSGDADEWGVFAQRFQGTRRVEVDFDGDGKGDLLWRNAATGNTAVWLLDGERPRAGGAFGALSMDWQIAGTGDVNGDGRADILWRNLTNGNVAIWHMNGLEMAAAQTIATIPLDWTIEQFLDTNGDGRADILWRRTTGATVIWQMDGFTGLDYDQIGAPPLDWRIVGTGDFDGDGRADILWRNTDTGNTVIWLMDGLTRRTAASVGAPDTAWQTADIGDFNGDGLSDILWRNTANGAVVIWQMNGLEIAAHQMIAAPALTWTIKHVRDTDGDGLADIVWRHAVNGTAVVWRMSGFTIVAAEPIGQVDADWQLR